MTIESSFERIGLSRQESVIYLSALKLGVAKVSEIAKKANAKREAAYYTLKLLQEKGYISEVIKSGVKYYSAIQPKKILEIIEEEKREKTESIKDVLPELESLQKIAFTRPKVEVYEGVEGFKTITSRLVEKENQKICCYVTENILHFLPTFHLQFRRRRKERNVSLRLITERTKYMQEIKKKDKEELRVTRFADKIMKGIDVAFFILDEALIIIRANEKEQVGVYIKEASVAKLQRHIFEELWKVARK
jgi:sugar-specific transcriptional regulator TrmB